MNSLLPTIYVINLDGSIDRLQAISLQFSKLNLKFKKIEAIDGRIINNIDKYVDNNFFCSYMGRFVGLGEVGCFLSHIKALKIFLESGDKCAIILEDDAILDSVFKNNFVWLSNLLDENNLSLINLGPSDYKYSSRWLSSNGLQVLRAHRFPMRATGILWSRSAALTVINEFDRIQMPWDNFLRFIFLGKNASCSVFPSIVNANDLQSDIDSISPRIKSNFSERGFFYYLKRMLRMTYEKFVVYRELIYWRIGFNK